MFFLIPHNSDVVHASAIQVLVDADFSAFVSCDSYECFFNYTAVFIVKFACSEVLLLSPALYIVRNIFKKNINSKFLCQCRPAVSVAVQEHDPAIKIAAGSHEQLLISRYAWVEAVLSFHLCFLSCEIDFMKHRNK